uniref:V-SNARE coiled-coil homology domain-containing protein n=1 Tax=Paramormyrops kingsleyae TaxID=1676925 RepID=A0A3B3QQ40_9TELE|nr:putative uncharacterized protein C3orf49 [Paramormyrops kingsleyae]
MRMSRFLSKLSPKAAGGFRRVRCLVSPPAGNPPTLRPQDATKRLRRCFRKLCPFRRDSGRAAAMQVDLVEEERQKYVGSNLVLRSRRLFQRVSVSRPATHTRKVADKKGNKKYAFWRGKSRRKPAERSRGTSRQSVEQLQGQVDGLIDAVVDSSTRLIARRQSELEQCQEVGGEILQSSSQFQRVSRKAVHRHHWRNTSAICWCC